MPEFTRQQLSELLSANGDAGPRVSIYVPTVRAGSEQKKNPIRFKNMLREAEAQLEARKMRRPDVDALLERAWERLEDIDFWKHQEDGYAAFIDRDGFREFRVPERFDELCIVGPVFHVSPLMPLLSDNHRFLVLALAQKSVRVLSGTRFDIRTLALDDVPASLPDALGRELTEPSLQHRSMTQGTVGFHGQGAGSDDVEPELRKFVTMVDRALLSHFDTHHPPLVLAAVDHLAALYRQHSRWPNLAAQTIGGNHDDSTEQELHARAWDIVRETVEAEHDETLRRLDAAKRGGNAAIDIEDVLLAAHDGRIDTLVMTRGRRAWGRFDAQARSVSKHDGRNGESEDLLERAAVEALRTQSRVLFVEPGRLPENVQQAAILRF